MTFRNVILLGLVICSVSVHAQNVSQNDSIKTPTIEQITKERQNPVSGLKSIFLQDVLLPVGQGNANSFSIQPVWPFRIGKKWKLNTYTIIPFQSLPPITPGGEKASGLGNILFNGFFRPEAKPKGHFVWGIGPALQIPTRTAPELGSNRVSLGPAALAYISSDKLSGGLVLQNFWSLGGTDANKINLLSAQYIAYYNFQKGWFIESNSTITANWLADNSNTWIVPVGGGPGKTFKMGKYFYAAAVQGFYNAIRPDHVGSWMVIAQFQIILSQ